MQSIFAVTVPFFALVLLGYLAARYRMLSDAAIPGLNVFVLYFALPCALFRFGMSMPVLQSWIRASSASTFRVRC